MELQMRQADLISNRHHNAARCIHEKTHNGYPCGDTSYQPVGLLHRNRTGAGLVEHKAQGIRSSLYGGLDIGLAG
jgi:hypothetical protein